MYSGNSSLTRWNAASVRDAASWPAVIFEELEKYPEVRHNISLRLRAASESIPAEAS